MVKSRDDLTNLPAILVLTILRSFSGRVLHPRLLLLSLVIHFIVILDSYRFNKNFDEQLSIASS